MRYKEQLNNLKMTHTKIKIMLDLANQNQKQLNSVLDQTINLLLDSVENARTDKFSELCEAIVPSTQLVIGEELGGIKKLR